MGHQPSKTRNLEDIMRRGRKREKAVLFQSSRNIRNAENKMAGLFALSKKEELKQSFNWTAQQEQPARSGLGALRFHIYIHDLK